MDMIARDTKEFQRLAAGSRPWHAALALLLAGAGAVAVLAYLEYVNEAFGRLAERIKQLAG